MRISPTITINETPEHQPGMIMKSLEGELLVSDGTGWVSLGSTPKKEIHFMDTEKGQERLKEMFMEWMKERYPEDLL